MSFMAMVMVMVMVVVVASEDAARSGGSLWARRRWLARGTTTVEEGGGGDSGVGVGVGDGGGAGAGRWSLVVAYFEGSVRQSGEERALRGWNEPDTTKCSAAPKPFSGKAIPAID
mmetsp:Transcript_5956/g.14367  ORF Transcript_5956/g.14367 Transcript_5956/m.14367 type:complete len:115 (+) Transcript_5956:388-732(+)